MNPANKRSDQKNSNLITNKTALKDETSSENFDNQSSQATPLHSIVRTKVLNIIINKIQKCNEMRLARDKVFILAKCIEKRLFKTATSIQTYSNLLTLEERIKNVSTGVGVKLLSIRKARRETVFIDINKKKLREKVGSALCDEICKVVDEISVIKKSFLICMLPLQKKNDVPNVVRAIFYGTKLTQAFQLLQVKGVIDQPWEPLITEAKNNIQKFRDFEKCCKSNNDLHAYRSCGCHFQI